VGKVEGSEGRNREGAQEKFRRGEVGGESVIFQDLREDLQRDSKGLRERFELRKGRGQNLFGKRTGE